MTQKHTSTTMTIRLDLETKARLEKAAKSQNRSKSFLAAQAIEHLLKIQEAQDVGVRQAIASLDAHGGVSHEKVKAWVASWGTDSEQQKPNV